MSMNSFFRTAGLTGLAALLAGGTAIAQEPVNLVVWTDPVRQAMFEAYDAAHDDVTLELVTVGHDELVSKILLGMRAAGEVPDVIFMFSSVQAAQLAARRSNYLLPLDELVSQEVRDEFYPGANDPCTINGELRCMRNDLAQVMIWYDQRLVTELGITIPTTWEEYASLGAELGPKGYALGVAGEPIMIWNALESAGCDVAAPVDGKDETLSIHVTEESCVKAARLIDGMVANGSLLKFTYTAPETVQKYQDGKIPLTVGASWHGKHVIVKKWAAEPSNIGGAVPLKWGGQDQAVTWSWGGGMFGGWRDTKHPEKVADVLTWLTTSEAVQVPAVTFPAHRPSAEVWGKADASYFANDVFAAQVAAGQQLNPHDVALRFSVVDSLSKIVIQNMNGGGTIEEVLPALQNELVNLAKLNGYQVQ